MNQKQVTKAMNVLVKVIYTAIAIVFLWAFFYIGPHLVDSFQELDGYEGPMDTRMNNDQN